MIIYSFTISHSCQAQQVPKRSTEALAGYQMKKLPSWLGCVQLFTPFLLTNHHLSAEREKQWMCSGDIYSAGTKNTGRCSGVAACGWAGLGTGYKGQVCPSSV